MPIRDIITRQFRLFQGLRDMEEDNRILSRLYAQCAMELLLFMDNTLPLYARRALQRKVGDIVTQHPQGAERSRELLKACLSELEYAAPESAKAAERMIRSFVRRQFAFAADSVITKKELTHA